MPKLKQSLPLPIRDAEGLKSALSVADFPTMVMLLVQYGRDDAPLAAYAPYMGSPWDPRTRPVTPELRAEVEGRLFELLTSENTPASTELPDDLMRRMMAANVGEEITDEFVPLLMEQMGFQEPDLPINTENRAAPAPDFKVVVIGAGLTGMLAGIKLGQAGYNYEIFEKNDDIGGTWLENIYPGVAVDTPSHFYSYSFELNPEWSHYIPLGHEVQAYLRRVCDKYELRRHITFKTRVKSFVYDEKTATWTVTVEGPEGVRQVKANIVLNCHGVVNRWSLPRIKGLGDFKGTVVHTAGWDPAIVTRGKRIAVIGTGASAAQVAPAVAEDAAHLTVFQRARHWCLPYQRIPVEEGVRWALRNIPLYAEWFRFRTYWFTADGLYADSQVDPDWPHQDVSISARNHAVREYCLQNMRNKLGDRPDLIEKLLPDYPVYGKRIVMDVDWLNMFRRENVTLENEGIDHISETGIVLKDGREVPVDVIICATGFDIARMVGNMTIIGRDGRNLGEEWGDDDPRAYLGVSAAGYPNYFFTCGPNSGPNHAGGVNLIVEAQIHYIIRCIEQMRAQGAAAIEASPEAVTSYHAEVDETMKGMIWSHAGSKSYYFNSKGRNIVTCPFRLVDYWTKMREPKLDMFIMHKPA